MPRPLTYAIGDIHGRFDLLEQALQLIARHAGGAPGRVIFLGDYVDRGPDSRRVVERLMKIEAAGAAVCLKGNHEDMMVRALSGEGRLAMEQWLRNGGGQTLMSYGVRPGEDPAPHVPGEHTRWMATLPTSTGDGRRIYVHAGLSPKTPFDRQNETSMLWIRERFLRAKAKELETHVVHGHTPLWEGKPDADEPELLPHRTNLDTAAFATGVLSIGVFDPDRDGGPVEVLTARGPAQVFAAREIAGEPAQA